MAWDIKYAAFHGGTGYFLSGEQAQAALDILQPLQVGYGAVVRIPISPERSREAAF
jgi:hypothetical protein